jgi:hypothetical protein
VAVSLCVWLAVLVRDERVGMQASGEIFSERAPTEPEVARALDRLKAAELLNPDPEWTRQRAALLLLRDRPAEALRVADDVLRRQPEDLMTWQLVFQATEGVDPKRAAAAWSAIRRLNPFATRQQALGMRARQVRAPARPRSSAGREPVRSAGPRSQR